MKLSKYNYFTYNSKNELLLLNTCLGKDSLIKVPSSISKKIETVLSGNEKIETLPSNILNQLTDYGYIVSEEYNETDKLKNIYINYVSDSRLHLTIIPTEQCNFRCKYCYESFPDNTMNYTVQKSIVKFLEKNMYKYSSLHVSWFGGEPLLAIETIEQLSKEFKRICGFYKKTYSATITTNGYLLDANMMKRLINCNVVYFQITIDGTKEIHDIQRPHKDSSCSTYDQIINNLMQIKNKIKSRMFRITIRSNFSKLYVDRIDNYLKIFYSLFGDDKRFMFFVRPVMDWGGDKIDDFKTNLIEEKFYDNIYEKIISSNCKLDFIYDEFLVNAGGLCEAGKKNYYIINADGGIYKCTCFFQEYPEMKIGELLENGTMDINKEKECLWLCGMQSCKSDCFYAPICLKEPCAAVKVIKEKKNKCPLEKQSLSKVLQLLDKNNVLRSIEL